MVAPIDKRKYFALIDEDISRILSRQSLVPDLPIPAGGSRGRAIDAESGLSAAWLRNSDADAHLLPEPFIQGDVRLMGDLDRDSESLSAGIA